MNGPIARKALVADDDPTICRLAEECLRQRGWAVTVARDGVEACRYAEAEAPALALFDLLLPRRDGYTTLLHLRSRKATQNTPVLLLSGEPAEEQEETARVLGANGYLSKPFSPQKLLQAVESVLHDAATAKETR